MTASLVISLDAMGGDHGPDVVVPAAAIALERNPKLGFVMFGDEARIAPLLSTRPLLAACTRVVHTDLAVAMDAKPSVALRQGRWKSSMWKTLQAVRDGEAQAAVSGGNTGALMAMSKFCLRTVTGIERPAIAAIWPTVSSECIVLDVGANVGANAEQLAQFAIMGAAMARAIFGLKRPSVALLNIGVEEVKGLDEVKRAHGLLRALSSDNRYTYIGFIEGDRIGHGAADVVVTEGFSGNIALKTAEGTAKQIAEYIRAAMRSSLMSQIGAVLAQGAFRALKEKMDPRRMNGGVFLGLNGLVIKSHGGADAMGFASAIDLAYDIAKEKIVAEIDAEMAAFQDEAAKAAGAIADAAEPDGTVDRQTS